MQVPPYLRELNPEQRQAALATEGPVLVLAGAGSGKTRTLVHRIVHLLRGMQVPGRRILALTFTNRAAAEMRERVAAVAGREARGVTLATFHSLGVRILREHGAAVGLPAGFSIYATADQLGLLRAILAEEVRIVPTAGTDAYDPRQLLGRISAWKNRLVTPAEAKREVSEGRLRENRSDDYDVLAADLYPRYQHALRAAGACDFDDLLLLPVQLLGEQPEVREALWRRWHYLMVDEYQDTNGAQLELARLLAGPRKNLCVVGDDDQSIYAWRGADVRNILDFERHFPGARVILLEQNYRSTQRILDAANATIAHNHGRRGKRLRTDNGLGPLLDRWEFAGAARPAEEEEAEMVAREIGVRRWHEQLRWGDFAVLYRTNLQGRPLEEALRGANIPYRVVGGTSYFDRKEIADALAYLRLALNPRDEVGLRRVINHPVRGIGRVTLLRLVDAARASNQPLWTTLERAEAVPEINTAQAQAVRRFVELIGEARDALPAAEAEAAGGGAGSLERWVAALLGRVRLEDAIRAENRSDRAAEIRVENLRDLVASVGSYEARVWAGAPLPDEEADWTPPTLAGFLERVSLNQAEDDRGRGDAEADPDRVTLMTLHSAKGLEFSHVFLVGLEEEILPHARSVNAAGKDGAPDPIAEERRLFYVGLTRARHRLTLSGCATRRRGGEAVPRQSSRFVAEIPPDLLHVRSSAQRTSLSEGDREELKANFFSQMRDLLAG